MKTIGDILNTKNSFNNSNTENEEGYSDDLNQIFENALDKQEAFDRFLTYRRRMARLGAVQTLYLYDIRTKNGLISSSNNIFGTNKTTDIEQLCQDVINFYRNVFFTQQEYGWNKKSKKLDESFMFDLVNTCIQSIDEIDNFIQSRLNGDWTTSKLDYVLRAIIRCAVAEILIGVKIEKAVLCSEYTNLAGNFFSGKEIGFINGIIDKLYSTVVKLHPFIDGITVNNEIEKNEQ